MEEQLGGMEHKIRDNVLGVLKESGWLAFKNPSRCFTIKETLKEEIATWMERWRVCRRKRAFKEIF